MSHHLTVPRITYKSFQKTIATDSLVFRWFLFLVFQPHVKKDFVTDDVVRGSYRRLTLSLFFYHLLAIACFTVSVLLVWKQQWTYVVIGAPFFAVFYWVQGQVKNSLISICMKIIEKFFDEARFKQNTLYQVCEIISSHYQVSSLVDGVIAVDTVMRKVLLLSVFITVFIQLLGFWQGVLTLVLMYYFGFMVVNTAWVYKTLMK